MGIGVVDCVREGEGGGLVVTDSELTNSFLLEVLFVNINRVLCVSI